VPDRAGVIYALCDPDTREIRYVGRTVHRARTRLNGHLLAAAAGAQLTVSHWLRSLPCEPLVRVLEDEVPEPELPGVERRWIAQLLEQGARLTNVADRRRERVVIL
jgi:hypothetical protein